MQKLNQSNLACKVSESIDHKHNFSMQSYERDCVQPGIVHFGVGNFHRSHQAIYVDKLLGQGYLDWGIIGVSMRSPKIRDALKPQDFLFTEVTLGNKIEFRIIGSILNILVAPENPSAVINQIADEKIKLVTTTITEKGYYLYSGKVDSSHPDMVSDSACLKKPRSIYGYLAAAVIQRCNFDGPPLNVLCCDNIHDGGTKLKAGVYFLLEKHSQVAYEWATKNVSFASSMVDRVSPATDEELKFYTMGTDPDGRPRLQHMEVALRADIAEKYGIKAGEELTPDKAKLIGYRIPQQGKSSTVLMRIAKILPNNHTKAIIVPAQITALTGSDFDIDKMMLIFPDVM